MSLSARWLAVIIDDGILLQAFIVFYEFNVRCIGQLQLIEHCSKISQITCKMCYVNECFIVSIFQFYK